MTESSQDDDVDDYIVHIIGEISSDDDVVTKICASSFAQIKERSKPFIGLFLNSNLPKPASSNFLLFIKYCDKTIDAFSRLAGRVKDDDADQCLGKLAKYAIKTTCFDPFKLDGDSAENEVDDDDDDDLITRNSDAPPPTLDVTDDLCFHRMSLFLSKCIGKLRRDDERIRVFSGFQQKLTFCESRGTLLPPPLFSFVCHLWKVASDEGAERRNSFIPVEIDDAFFTYFVEMLRHFELSSESMEAILAAAASIALHSLSSSCASSSSDGKLELIWRAVVDVSQSKQGHPRFGFKNEVAFSVACTIFQRLVDSFVVEESDYWSFLLRGLTHSNSGTRKRARFLYGATMDRFNSNKVATNVRFNDRTIFFLPPIGSERRVASNHFWNTVLVFFETLEEKQAHVIKPILPRFNDILDFVETMSRDDDDDVVDVAWICAILSRALAHESRGISRWGIASSLKLASRPPIRRQLRTSAEYSFVFDDLISALNHEHVFSRWGCDDDTLEGFSPGEKPPMAEALGSFIRAMTEADDEDVFSVRSSFYLGLLVAVKNVQWGQIQMVFIAESLAQVSPLNCFANEVVEILKEMVQGNVAFMSPICQRAVKRFMIKIMRSTIDLSLVSPSLVFKLAHEMLETEADPANRRLIRRDFTSLILSGDKSRTRAFIANSTKELDALQYSNMDAGETKRIANWLVATLDIATSMKELDDEETSVSKIRLWAKGMVDQILEVAQAAFHRPYIPKHKVNASLLFISAFCDLLEERRSSSTFSPSTTDFLTTFFDQLKPICPRILHFILQQLREFLNSPIDVKANEMLLFNELMVKLPTRNDREVESYLTNVFEMASHLLSDGKNALDFSVGGLLANAWSQLSRRIETSSIRIGLKPESFHQRLLECKLECPEGLAKESWRTIRDLHVLNCWKIIDNHPEITQSKTTESSIRTLLGLMDVAKADGLRFAFRCVGRLLKGLVEKDTNTEKSRLIETCFAKMWSLVKEFYDIAEFWSLYAVFIDVVFDFVAMDDDAIALELRRIFEEIIVLSDSRVGLTPVLARKCFSSWLESLKSDLDVTRRYATLIHDFLIFGPVHHKYTRNIADTLDYLTHRHERSGDADADLPFLRRELECGVPAPHAMTRVYAVNFLARVTRFAPSHSSTASFLRLLAEHLTSTDTDCSHRRGAHYANSFLHRRSHRAWQALSLIQMALKDDEEFQTRLLTHCLGSLEGNLPVSVRFMIEWTISRILCLRLMALFADETPSIEDTKLKVRRALKSFTTSFRVLPLKRVGSTSSLIDVVVMILIGIESHLFGVTSSSSSSSRSVYFTVLVDEMLPFLLPLTTSQHFITRAYAIAGLSAVWPAIIDRLPTEELERYRILEYIVDFNRNKTDGLKKSGDYVEDLFVFKGFQPMEDLTLETLYYLLPKLTDVTDEEWIHPEAFTIAHVPSETGEVSSWRDGIRLRNPESKILSCAPLNLKTKSHLVDNDEKVNGEGDVQKKISPSVPLLATPFDTVKRPNETCRESGCGLIVIASLVDKIPNLGGLCRTAEIFGVIEVVVSSRKLVENKDFQNLSVTSEKWLKIKEVQMKDLRTYLEHLRMEKGFSIVALEQSERSQSLTSFHLPAKTALLLGNEKRGIPANILSAGRTLIDACVEIPQCGVIRSLNVHVSGALLMWEFVKQHVFLKDSALDSKLEL